MPSRTNVRLKFQDLLRPGLAVLMKWGITPNQISLLSIAGSLCVGGLLFWNPHRLIWLIVPAWLIDRMALNIMDGMAAREYNQESASGKILHKWGNMISDVTLTLPWAFLFPDLRWPVIFFIVGTLLSEFSGKRGPFLGETRNQNGPMSQSDRAFLMGILAILWAVGYERPIFYMTAFYLGTILTLITSWNRWRNALKERKS